MGETGKVLVYRCWCGCRTVRSLRPRPDCSPPPCACCAPPHGGSPVDSPAGFDADHLPFLLAVCDFPEDDGPRLVYADWLDERGGRDDTDRAAFVRCQVELAARPRVACEADGKSLGGYGVYIKRCRCPPCRLKRREYQVSCRHVVWDWNPWAWECGPAVGGGNYRRGFIERVACSGGAWLARGPQLVRQAPVLEVGLTDPWLYGPVGRGPSAGTYFYARRDLPAELWPHVAADRKNRATAAYLTAAAARAALSRAAVLWARGPHPGLRALPPLRPPA